MIKGEPGLHMCNVLDYLEQTASVYSDRIAVDDGKTTLTWKELRDNSKKIGTFLLDKSERQKPIVILMEKSTTTLSVMFGAVYAGCFYVMVDPGQPADRVKRILNVLNAEIVITICENEKLLDEAMYQGERVLLDNYFPEEIDEIGLAGVRDSSNGSDLLYGIFTSGSTGIPKGIVVSHKAVIDFISHFKDLFGFSEEDRIGNQAPFDFDVSVKDIYTSVMTGATLVLIPRQMFSTPPVLLDYLEEKRISSLTWAVSALTLVTALKGLKYKVPHDVKKILFSGEVMPTKHLKMWREALPDARFVNLYGPTEITCNCTYFEIPSDFSTEDKLPIGISFPGRRVFLRDDEGNEVTTPFVVGEICVEGESLSEGYYNNEAETKKRFLYFDKDNFKKRFYCTGDLGYFDEQGLLYFSGRKDFQIKHMGHRIELEEIEQSINKIPGVLRSCCLMNEKRQQLVAFYFGSTSPDDVRVELKKSVPVYMVPHKILQTDEMPLNKNGKTDRDFLRKKLM